MRLLRNMKTFFYFGYIFFCRSFRSFVVVLIMCDKLVTSPKQVDTLFGKILIIQIEVNQNMII